MSVSMLLGESGGVGNRHFEMKGLRNESLFLYTQAGLTLSHTKGMSLHGGFIFV